VGPAAIFDWMLKRNLKSFDPYGHAFRTEARSRMISDVQSDLGAWVRTLLASPETVLKVGNIKLAKDLLSSKELLSIYDPVGRTGTTANGLGRELRRAGVSQAVQGAPLKLMDGTQTRYYIIRNAEQWARATPAACCSHLNQFTMAAEGPKPAAKGKKF
jgi:hypothetical protein